MHRVQQERTREHTLSKLRCHACKLLGTGHQARYSGSVPTVLDIRIMVLFSGTLGDVLWIGTHCTGYTDAPRGQRDSRERTLDGFALHWT